MTQTTAQDDDGLLAAEYVVGLLAADERAAVEARVGRDPAFAAKGDAWEAHLAGLNEEYGTVQPRATVKAAIDRRLFATASRKPRWWGWIGLVAAVLALAVFIGSLAVNDGDGPRLVAQLESTESTYLFSVEISEGGMALDVAINAGSPVADRTFELWLIPADGAPRSLGTFVQADRLQSAAIAQMAVGTVLAVSLEPVGGSPTGTPTGPVLAIGTLNDA